MTKKNNINIKQILKVFLFNKPIVFSECSLKGLKDDQTIKKICELESPADIHTAVSYMLINDYDFTDREMNHHLIPYMKPFKMIITGINNLRDVVRRDSVRENVKGLIFYIYLGIIIKKLKSIYDFL